MYKKWNGLQFGPTRLKRQKRWSLANNALRLIVDVWFSHWWWRRRNGRKVKRHRCRSCNGGARKSNGDANGHRITNRLWSQCRSYIHDFLFCFNFCHNMVSVKYNNRGRIRAKFHQVYLMYFVIFLLSNTGYVDYRIVYVFTVYWRKINHKVNIWISDLRWIEKLQKLIY